MANKQNMNGLGNLLYIFGFLNLILEVVTFTEFNTLNSLPSGWIIAGGLTWTFFMFAMACFIGGANLKKNS